MRKFIRKAVGWGVATSYVLSGCRRRQLAAYSMNGAVLSVFGHSPRPIVLDSLLGWLVRRGFSFISTDELLSVRDGKRAWEPRMAWLTFDDGWAGFERELLPILERYQVPATIFVAPKETERGKIWTNSVMGLTSEWHKWYDLHADERYSEVDKVLAENLGKVRQLADKDELRRLSRHPLVTLENHTYTHLSCSHRPVDEVVDEVRKTQGVLTEWTGRTPRLMCYPFGHCTDETDNAIRELGLIPVSSFPGHMTVETVGRFRNMFHDAMGTQENIGRILEAWPRINVEAY